jgi:hypothetical protein
MTRRLKVDEFTPDAFAIMWEGFLAAGSAKDQQTHRAIAVMRLERSISKKLKAVSVEMEDKFPGADIHTRSIRPELKNGDEFITFTQEEFDLLVRYMESVPWKIWKIEEAMNAIDWVNSAEKVAD